MATPATIRVLVPDGPLRLELGKLPENVELTAQPDPDVELVVLAVELVRQLPGLLEQLPGLRVVQSVFAGVDGIVRALPEGVVVCSARGVHDIAVSEWVMTMLLALRRRLPELLEFQRRGEWAPINTIAIATTGPSPIGPVDDLDGATVLVLGYGSIGRAVARRLEPFGSHVVGVARHARADAYPPEALDALVPSADAVVVLTPLTEQTDRLIDAAFIARMKPGALLLNAGRGRVVDTRALLDALHAGHIRAALDVTDPEPLPDGHPLWSAPNVIITPHIAGGVSEWEARAYQLAGDQIRRYTAGEPLRNVQTPARERRRLESEGSASRFSPGDRT